MFNTKDKIKISNNKYINQILNINSIDKDYDLSTYYEEVKQEIEKL